MKEKRMPITSGSKLKMQSMNEVFFYKPNPLITDVWKPSPHIDGEWYKLLLVNDDNGLMECRITNDTAKSDEMDANPNDNCYFHYGDYIYDAKDMDQITDFLKGYDR